MSSKPDPMGFLVAYGLFSALIALGLVALVYCVIMVIQLFGLYWIGVYLVMFVLSMGICWHFRAYEVVKRD